MKNISFEWDEKKNSGNNKKHGIPFEEAQTVFLDPNARTISDPDHSDEEERFVIMGISEQLRILTVCHCYRENDSLIRIISARKATKREQKIYQEYL